MKLIKRSIICICLGVAIWSCQNQSKEQAPAQSISFTKEGEAQLLEKDSDSIIVILDIEFAISEYETQTGLMYRDSMAKNQGMLFIFDDVRLRSFYMKNTRIPLDIIYLSENLEIVSFQKNARPLDTKSLPSDAPAKYVLEISGGLADEWGLKIGDRLQYQGLK